MDVMVLIKYYFSLLAIGGAILSLNVKTFALED
jgi:hypothetical protein